MGAGAQGRARFFAPERPISCHWIKQQHNEPLTYWIREPQFSVLLHRDDC